MNRKTHINIWKVVYSSYGWQVYKKILHDYYLYKNEELIPQTKYSTIKVWITWGEFFY